jgi:hypothetical protein
MNDKNIVSKDDLVPLTEAVKAATAAAERLVRCAESISNPVYSVSMRGHRGELQILAVRHFQGQICITVEDVNMVPSGSMKTIGQNRQGELIEQERT